MPILKKGKRFLICAGIFAVCALLAWGSYFAFSRTGLSVSIAPPIIVFVILFTLICGIVSRWVPQSRFLHFFYFRDWKNKSKILIITLVVLFIVSTVLCALKPSEEEMIEMASEQVRREMKEDENRSIKRVSVTYQSLYFVNYISFQSTTGDFSEKHVGFVGEIYSADEGTMNTVGNFISYTYRMLGCQQNVLYGVKLTIFLTASSVVCGLILSVFLALGKISRFKILSKICSGYIFFFRGTPLLIQLFCVYLAIPGMIQGFSWKNFALSVFPSVGAEAVYWGAFIAAFIAFSLNSAAYCAEIVRAAIQSIDKGQNEAAKALGMSYGQTMSKIIIPQSLGRLVPPVANEFIMVLKDASLVFAISLQDITTISRNIATNEASFIVFLPALILFLIVTAFFSMIFNKLEKYFSKYY